MDGTISAERFGHDEISEELLAVFETVAQATAATAADGPKYPPEITRRLAREIVCRTYEGAVFELHHLVGIAETAFGAAGFETLFWDRGRATPGDFRRRLREAAAGRPGHCARLTLSPNQARLSYEDGDFAVSYGRMPYLSALMEFLVTALGYQRLERIFRGPATPVTPATPATPATMASVSAAANATSREIYQFLKPHLPAAQAMRKYRQLMSFLRRRHGGRQFGPEDLDDGAVLEFWIMASADRRGGCDFRKFATVFAAFVRLHMALKAGRDRQAMAHPQALGPDRAAGEMEPADVAEAIAGIDTHRAPFDVLRTAPADAIRFFNKRETAMIEPVVESGDAALAMPLSVMRVQVFGARQARITQARRRGETLPSAAPAEGGYREHSNSLDAMSDHVERILLASFHILASARHGEAASVLLGLCPDMDLSPLAPLFADRREVADNVVEFSSPSAGAGLLSRIAGFTASCPELASFVDRARDAWRRIARQGFRQQGDIEGFAAAVPALLAIRKQIGRYGVRLSRANWERQYAADRDIFFAQFRKLYGESG